MKVVWRTNQQFWLSHNAVLHSWCSFGFLSVNQYPREFNILSKKKNTNELGQAWENIAGNHRIPWQKKIVSYSDPADTLENKLNNLKPSYSRKKSFPFQKKLKKCSCLGGWILPTRINNNHRKLRRVSCTIHDLSVWDIPFVDTCQYFSRSQAKQAFPSFPSPSFISWFSFHFLRGQNHKSLSTVFFCSKPNGKASYTG